MAAPVTTPLNNVTPTTTGGFKVPVTNIPTITKPTTPTLPSTPAAPTTTSGTGSTNLTVPPLGTALTPQSQPVATTTPTTTTNGTATSGNVGMLTKANASNVGPLADISNGQINPMDSTNTASQLDAITNANSPYIQLAKQQGMLTAAGRGLENSSLASGASEAAAVAAAAPLAQQNAQEATSGQLQNSQLDTQASEFNSSQQTAAQELQAQLDSATSQTNAQLTTSNNEFNAQQTQAADAANAAAKNQMTAQTAALLEDMNKQDLSGAQAANLARIQANSNQLIASNQSASSLYTTYMSSLSQMMANKDIAPGRIADSMTAMQSMLESGLGVIDAMNGMSLDVTLPTYSSNGSGVTTTGGSGTVSIGPGGVTTPAKPGTTTITKPAVPTPIAKPTPKPPPGMTGTPGMYVPIGFGPSTGTTPTPSSNQPVP